LQRTVRTANVGHKTATCPVMAPTMGPTQARDRGGGEGSHGGEGGCYTSLVRSKEYTNSRPHVSARMGKSDLLQGKTYLQTSTPSTICAWPSASSSVPWSLGGGGACGEREARGNGGAGACGGGDGAGAGRSEGRGGVGRGGSGGLRLGGVGGTLEPKVESGVLGVEAEERQREARARLASKLWVFVQDVLRQLHRYSTVPYTKGCGCHAAGPDAAVLSWAIESEVLHRDFLDAVLASDQSLQRWIEQFAAASQIGMHENSNTRLAVAWSTLLLLLPRDALPYNPPPIPA
jgi:hypothetical protein